MTMKYEYKPLKLRQFYKRNRKYWNIYNPIEKLLLDRIKSAEKKFLEEYDADIFYRK